MAVLSITGLFGRFWNGYCLTHSGSQHAYETSTWERGLNRKVFLTQLKEEDLRIRKEYGIKDDEDWFDGRWGIRKHKRSK
jgi:hypothetical protein